MDKQTIIIGIDDTILKSTEQINKQLQLFPDYPIPLLYESNTFFYNVSKYEGFDEFLNKFQSQFNIVLLTKGTSTNINKKVSYLFPFPVYDIPPNTPKSAIIFPNTYLAIDSNITHLQEINSPSKILFNPKTPPPPNSNIYTASSWYDIIDMIEFDNYLRKEGIILG